MNCNMASRKTDQQDYELSLFYETFAQEKSNVYSLLLDATKTLCMNKDDIYKLWHDTQAATQTSHIQLVTHRDYKQN